MLSPVIIYNQNFHNHKNPFIFNYYKIKIKKGIFTLVIPYVKAQYTKSQKRNEKKIPVLYYRSKQSLKSPTNSLYSSINLTKYFKVDATAKVIKRHRSWGSLCSDLSF